MRTLPDDAAIAAGNTYRQKGITKREYFALKAMQALISSGNDFSTPVDHSDIPGRAVRYADALIAELNKPPPGV